MTHDIIIGNAAGTCKTLTDVQKFVSSGLTEITVGSVTVEPLEGNLGTVHYQDTAGQSINALGLPNPGIDIYQDWFPDMLKVVRSNNKKLWISIAPIEDADLDVLLCACIRAGVDGIEINGGCPNVWKGETQKLPLSYQPAQLFETLLRLLDIKRRMHSSIDIRLKLSPGDPGRLSDIAIVMEKIRGGGPPPLTLVTSNTWPNGFMYDWHEEYETPVEPAIHPKYGGVSGFGYKAIGLGQVRQLKVLLPDYAIIGVGGISTGWDVWEYFDSGASGVQVGAALYYSPRPNQVINEILEIYSALL